MEESDNDDLNDNLSELSTNSADETVPASSSGYEFELDPAAKLLDPSPSDPTKSFPTINDVLLSKVVMPIISTSVTNFFAKCLWGMFRFS